MAVAVPGTMAVSRVLPRLGTSAKRTMMKQLSARLVSMFLASSVQAAEPIRLVQDINFGEAIIRVPTELYLSARNDRVIEVKVAGNLRSLQQKLPAILSAVVEDTCERRIGLEIREVWPEGDALRLIGRVQILTYLCFDLQDPTTRVDLISNITEVNALVSGRIRDNCLEARLDDLFINPGGLIGEILNITNLTELIRDEARDAINEALREEVECIDIPRELQTIETQIRSGGFRDFGNGQMGFVVQGTINVKASNLIELISMLAKEGALGN